MPKYSGPVPKLPYCRANSTYFWYVALHGKAIPEKRLPTLAVVDSFGGH